jgi:hypothetical protein
LNFLVADEQERKVLLRKPPRALVRGQVA